MDENKEVKVEPVALAVEPETIPAVVVEAKPEPEAAKEPEVIQKKAAAPAEAKVPEVKIAGAGIFVQLSALKYLSRRKNSRSVTSVQVRLIELGYITAGDDDRGHFGEGTKEALLAFQSENKIKDEDFVSEATITTLFKGTAVEVVA